MGKYKVIDMEDEDKYYVKHRFLYDNADESYMTYSKYNNTYFLSNMYYDVDYQTQFTMTEIDEIKKKFNTDLKDFKIIKVIKRSIS